VFDVESGWKGMDATRFFAPQARNIQPPDVDGPTGDSTIEQVGTDRYFKVKSTTAQVPTGEAGGRIISLREVTELKRTNKRLDQFAAMVSHDLRTPLNNAAIQTDRLADERSDGRIGSIKAELDRMEAIIDDMLRLARAGEDIEATEACSLRELVQEVFETVQTDGAKLDCRVGDATVEADPVRLFQLLENLFRNALDHNDTPLTVRVGTVGASGDGADPDVRAGFFIEDDGEGLSDSDRDEIFEHGYTTRRDGNGYGLSIVRSIVEAHGWEIHVTDGADGGARFEITAVETA
jgi:signal transduction histidine kinase